VIAAIRIAVDRVITSWLPSRSSDTGSSWS